MRTSSQATSRRRRTLAGRGSSNPHRSQIGSRNCANDASQLEIVQYAATREDVLARLDELSRGAQADGAWSAAIRAEELKGRELGMFAPRPEPNVPWDGDLRKLSDSQLQNLMASLEAHIDQLELLEITAGS